MFHPALTKELFYYTTFYRAKKKAIRKGQHTEVCFPGRDWPSERIPMDPYSYGAAPSKFSFSSSTDMFFSLRATITQVIQSSQMLVAVMRLWNLLSLEQILSGKIRLNNHARLRSSN